MRASITKLQVTLEKVWKAQQAYNIQVRAKRELSYEDWMEKYLLGAISEVNSILDEMNWKVHRMGKPLNRSNLARELADLTKYVFSMWEWSGFSLDDMLKYVDEKNNELAAQWQQDFEITYPKGCPIVILDLDGTVVDYRKGFHRWIKQNHLQELPADNGTSLTAMEIDLGLPYPIYVRMKKEFESSGGYADLPIYPEVASSLEELWQENIHIIAYTARPYQSYSRIWNDSWLWLRSNRIDAFVSELRIGREERIAKACELAGQGHPVVLVDDDPETAIRAANSNIPVFLRRALYNKGLENSNILYFDTFPTGVIQILLEGDPTNE